MDGISDLHRHLDGSLRPGTLDELALAAGREVPANLCFRPAMGLEEALARFAFTVSLLQGADAVRRVAAEMCEDAALDNVTTLEIRFAPQLHGGAIPEIVDAALDGVAGRAGVILCTLYGEDPSLLAELVAVAKSRPGVVGIDLAGGPAPGHDWRMTDYRPAFLAAKEVGLGRTVHAGEGRPAAEIGRAIEELGATRIGHGTTLLDDHNVLDLVVEREITIEACPTSNVHTGVIGTVRDHPIAKWLDHGVRVCVCADNTLLSDVTASEELRRVGEIPEMDDDKLALVTRYGHQGAFRR